MITITKQIYEEIAELLLEKIREKDFFNGTSNTTPTNSIPR